MSFKLPRVMLYTDGSCHPRNPGERGGWGAVLLQKNRVKHVSDFRTKKTTNNQAEVLAVVVGLSALKTRCNVTLYTDSMYVIYGICRLKKGRMPRTNALEWKKLKPLVYKHNIFSVHVDGHSGDVHNEEAHELAYEASKNKRTVNVTFLSKTN